MAIRWQRGRASGRSGRGGRAGRRRSAQLDQGAHDEHEADEHHAQTDRCREGVKEWKHGGRGTDGRRLAVESPESNVEGPFSRGAASSAHCRRNPNHPSACRLRSANWKSQRWVADFQQTFGFTAGLSGFARHRSAGAARDHLLVRSTGYYESRCFSPSREDAGR
jgi:hypothetical protein